MRKIEVSIILSVLLYTANTQYKIIPKEGYSPQIGIMVDMLEEIKDRIAEDVKDLSQEETDFLFDEKANSIGALIMHLIATEVYYQAETLEERMLSQEENDFWEAASDLGKSSRETLNGESIHYYLELWDKVRKQTLEGPKKKDDEWFANDIDETMNYHWAWFHILEHQANHMGQIALVKNRLPGS